MDNRTCIDICPNIGGIIWFSRLAERICVLVCEDATIINLVLLNVKQLALIAIVTSLAITLSTCVLCSKSMNYFEDPKTNLYTDRCPHLLSNFTIIITNIITPGHLFVNYKTQLCMYTCTFDVELQGIFADNTTHMCTKVS